MVKEHEYMEQKKEMDNAVLTFINDTKNGKYSYIDDNVVEVPRVFSSRDEYVTDGSTMPVYFSITN